MQKLRFVNGNGTEIDLTSGYFGVTNWEGFSNIELNIQAQQVPFHDGSVYLDGLLNERELTITLAVNDNNNLELRYELRRELISALNPKLGEGYLYYKNDYLERRIKVVPHLPIFENKNSNDAGTLKASITWTACDPYWEDVEETVVNLEKNTVTNIENKGDVKSQVVVNATNQGQLSISLENIVTRKKIVVNNDKDLTVNTNWGNKFVKENVSEFERTTFLISSFAKNNNVYLFGGNWLYYSTDNISIIPINNIELYSRTNVFYSELFHKFIITSGGYLYSSESGISDYIRNYYNSLSPFTFLDEFYENENCLVVHLKSGSVHKYLKCDTDLNSWSEITFPNSTTNEKIITKKGNNFVVREFNNSTSYIYETSDFSSFTSKLELSNEINSICCTENLIYMADTNGNIYRYNNSYSLMTTWTFTNITYLYFSTNRGLFASGDNLYLLGTSQWETIAENITVNNIVDFGTNVFIATTSGSFKVYNYELQQVNSINYKILNVDDIVLWQKDYNSFDGSYWTDKNFSSSDITSVVSFDNKLFGIKGREIKLSLDGEFFSTIKVADANIKKLISTPDYLVRLSGRNVGRSVDGIHWEDFPVTNNTSFSVYDICYSEDFDCYVAVGFGGIWFSENIETWEHVRVDYVWNHWKVLYDKKRKTFWTTLYNSGVQQGMYGYSQDGRSWTVKFLPEPQDSQSIAISDDGILVYGQIDGVCVMEPGRASFLYVKIDPSITIPPSHFGRESKLFYSKTLKLFFIVFFAGRKIYASSNARDWSVFAYTYDENFNSESEFFKIIYSKQFILRIKNKDNLISDLSEDSDMSFGLEVGDNYILPNFNGNLIYRQKYIGV